MTATAPPIDPNTYCDCGSGYFELHDSTRPAPSFSSACNINAAGSVIAYTGQARCIACGKPWEAGKRPKLSVVK